MMSGPQQALSTHELSQGKIHNSSPKIKLSHLNLLCTVEGPEMQSYISAASEQPAVQTPKCLTKIIN